MDTHIVMVPAPPSPSPVPTPTRFAFSGPLADGLSKKVFVEKMAAATVGSVAHNTHPYFTPPPTFFQTQPSNLGTVSAGSGKVFINGQAAARAGDRVTTCNDPADTDAGVIQSTTQTVYFA